LFFIWPSLKKTPDLADFIGVARLTLSAPDLRSSSDEENKR